MFLDYFPSEQKEERKGAVSWDRIAAELPAASSALEVSCDAV